MTAMQMNSEAEQGGYVQQVQLLRVPGSLPLTDAIDWMKSSGQRALVVMHGPGVWRLYRNDQVLHAWAREMQTCDDLLREEGLDVAVLMDEPGPSLQSEGVRRLLWGTPAPLVHLARRAAQREPVTQFLTLDTGLVARLSALPSVCVCALDHLNDSPPGRDGGKCMDCDRSLICI